VVALVSNGGWIDGNTADGMRPTMADDYSAIYVYNLRGNQRTAGELSRREGGKIFGSGSRNTVAIFIGVKGRGLSAHARFSIGISVTTYPGTTSSVSSPNDIWIVWIGNR
jgi:predicted helicase